MLGYKCYSLSLIAVSGSSTDSMHIIGYFSGDVVVDDDVDVGNIQASGSEVSSDKDIGFVGSKLGEVSDSLIKLHEGMKTDRVVS